MHLKLWIVVLLGLLLMTSPIFSQETDLESQLAQLQLSTLDFDTFLDESYFLLLGRNPELVIELSLQNDLGLDDVTLTDVSDAYQQESEMLLREILAQLQNFDRDTLSASQQISYDIYEWYLDDQVRAQAFRLHDFPVTFFITSDHSQTINFFTEIHPLVTAQDAADYVTRLGLVDDKFEQIIEKVILRAEAGIIPPQQMIQWSLGELNRLSGGRVGTHDYYIAFEAGIANIDELSEDERDLLLEQASQAVLNSVMPAYQNLANTMTGLLSDAPQDSGSWQYPDGDAYYAYTLRHHTTTDLTADDIHNLGLQELERIHTEMRVLFGELGYNTNNSIADLYSQLIRDGDFIPANQVVAAYEDLIDEAYLNLDGAFSRIPEAEVVVIGGSSGGYYIPAALDGTRPGAFYAAATSSQPYFNMPSLLYHEAIPGHHLQIAWAQELDLPAFRRSPLFTGYIEGWALYAERLALDLGWYDDDPAANLGRLQYEAFRAARLVVDTGIHSQQWTFNQAADFFSDNTGFGIQMAQGQIARYTVWAGQSTSYMVGMLEILRQRERLQIAFGDDFDLVLFHDIMLNNGSVPLAILDDIVTNYIAENQ